MSTTKKNTLGITITPTTIDIAMIKRAVKAFTTGNAERLEMVESILPMVGIGMSVDDIRAAMRNNNGNVVPDKAVNRTGVGYIRVVAAAIIDAGDAVTTLSTRERGALVSQLWSTASVVPAGAVAVALDAYLAGDLPTGDSKAWAGFRKEHMAASRKRAVGGTAKVSAPTAPTEPKADAPTEPVKHEAPVPASIGALILSLGERITDPAFTPSVAVLDALTDLSVRIDAAIEAAVEAGAYAA